MRGAKWLGVLVAAVVALWCAGPANAVVTPAAFGDCGRAAAARAMLRSDLPELAGQALPAGFPPFFRRPDFAACRDLNGDGRRDLVVEFGIRFGTVSSPRPWAILEVPRGRTEPKTVFLQAGTSYLELLLPGRVRVRRRGAAVVVTWARSRGAYRHEVRVSVSDGRRLLFLPRRGRRVRVPDVARRHRVVARVRGLDRAGRAGPARSGRLRR